MRFLTFCACQRSGGTNVVNFPSAQDEPPPHTLHPRKLLQVLQTQPDAIKSTFTSTTPIPPSFDTPRMLGGMGILDVGCSERGNTICGTLSFKLLILIVDDALPHS